MSLSQNGILGRRPRLLGGAIVILSTLALIAYLYGPLLWSPNDYLFTNKGDGLKNYYSFLYHIKYDSGPLHFEGMNHPYGEHPLYMDAQPLFSVPLQALSHIWPGTTDHAIGWLNLMILLSIPLGAFLLYLLFLHLKFDPFLAICFAIGWTLLSPQAFRMPWYQSLAYHWIIPGALLLWIMARKSRFPLRSSILIGLYVFLCAWIHPYWGAMLALLFGLLQVFTFFIQDEHFQRSILHLSLRALLPFFFFLLLARLSDPHTDRNPSPFGFYEFTSTPGVVFLPHSTEGSIYHPFFPKTDSEIMQHWEGRAYIGILGNLAILLLLIHLILKAFTNKTSSLGLSPPVRLLLCTGITAIALAMGLPFILPGGDKLLEWFPLVKQFRALGRLSLIFYYAVAILSLAEAHSLLQKVRSRWQLRGKIILGMACGCLLVLEGLQQHRVNTDEIGRAPNLFNPHVLKANPDLHFFRKALQAVDTSPYQAIVPLPWFHTGTEALHIKSQGGFEQFCYASAFSAHTGLPLTAIYGARTSLSETRKQFQMLAFPMGPKDFPQDFSDQRPFLIFTLKDKMLSPEEQRLYQLANPLFENKRVRLSQLDFDKIWEDPSHLLIQNFQQTHDSLFHTVEGFYLTKPYADIYYQDFESSPSPITFRGEGAWSADFSGQSVLLALDSLPFALNAGQSYELSFWYNHEENRTHNRFFLGKRSSDGFFQVHTTIPRYCASYQLQGPWTYCHWTFTAPQNPTGLAFCFEGSNYPQSIYLDDLLLKPTDCMVYRILSQSADSAPILWFNNFVLYP